MAAHYGEDIRELALCGTEFAVLHLLLGSHRQTEGGQCVVAKPCADRQRLLEIGERGISLVPQVLDGAA
ncbi:hypothetical protein V2J94_00715 [Streptomyces sp. DSM 41524]|uniref:Uncharacterized protein n=1 Tax=Streptomyces asiaticus subsp. ignotus TaxID=3098222 RepID=A0ABU7PPN9_9ACTN|nr:hypothetical protein [Streptomyces sp. DSM 41524]